jgi:hypothetical protein
MKKKVLVCSLIGLISGFSFSQKVGIKGITPVEDPYIASGTVLHIDAQGNTVVDTSGSVIEKDDDVVVDDKGWLGLGTLKPETKLHIQAKGGKGLRINDGTAQEGKIAVSSDANGKIVWGNRPNPARREGDIILVAPENAPNFRGKNLNCIKTSTIQPNGNGCSPAELAVRFTDDNKPLELTDGTWLIQLKYTVRTTADNNTGIGCHQNVNDYYVWTMLYDEADDVILTTVGVSPEKTGYCLTTPQISHVVKIEDGKTHKIHAYGSTSFNYGHTLVHRDGVYGSSGNVSYGAPYFYAVRLDSFNN